MADFIFGTDLSVFLEEMIYDADKYLILVSPYIKLHGRIKDELRKKKLNDKLEIIIVFGKNKEDRYSSISEDDINFLKDFPNIRICYEPNLHAKYYASEDRLLITSMNLHEFSQNTNVEVGIAMKPRNIRGKISDSLITDNIDAGKAASDYFDEMIEHSEKIFVKTPLYETSMLGLVKEFKESVVEVNTLETFFKNHKEGLQVDKYIKPEAKPFVPGFCIRTGKPVPFNRLRPMSIDAWKEWSKTKNGNQPENFCHYSGEPSNGETSYNKPIMRKNWDKAR